MTYADEDDVLYEIGMSKTFIQTYTNLGSSAVTTLINNYLASAEAKIRGLLQIPHVVHRERHLGTGEDEEFDLGPDDEEFYIDYDPADSVELVKACYFKKWRMKLPYPKSCDAHTDDATLLGTGAGTTVANSTAKAQAGTNAMQVTFGTVVNAYAYYPTTQDLNKNIDIFDFVSFRAETDDASTTFELRLYDKDGNYNYAYFKLPKADKSYIVNLDLDDDFLGSTGTAIDWDDVNLYYWEVRSDTANTILYIDNFNFNDEWWFTAPSGKLVISRKVVDPSSPYEIVYSIEEPPALNYPFYVTYTFDPFIVAANIPANIKTAEAQIAGAKLLSYLIGIREENTAFEVEAETGMRLPDRETLYHRRGSLLARAKENLAAYGYSHVQGGVAI